jgi:N-acetylmuramoyl-L-alanine amidase
VSGYAELHRCVSCYAKLHRCVVRRVAVGALAALAACSAHSASVAIDVGHYFARAGATSARGVPEFDYNLTLAREMADTLRARGHDVMVIGEDGLAADLYQRAPQAAGRDLLISVHHDSVQAKYMSTWEYEGAVLRYSDMQAGYSLFVSRRNPQRARSLACASAFGAALQGAGFVPSRYHADPVVGEAREYADEDYGVHYYDNLVVLHTATVPALLFEAGVLVNRHEELAMRDPRVRARIARSAADAVDACLAGRGPHHGS